MSTLEGRRVAYCHLEPLTERSAGPIFAVGTCRGLFELGLNPMLIAPAPELPADLPFEVRYLPQSKRSLGPLRPSWARALFRRVKDTLSGSGEIACAITRDIRLGLFLKRQLPYLPVVYEAHNFYGDLARKWPKPPREEGKLKRERKLSRLEPKLIGQCDGVLFLTEAMKDIFSEYYSLPPHVVAPSGCDEVPKVNRQNRSNIVAHIGRLYPDKGVELLLEAVSRCEDARLRVIGEGPERKHLQSKATQLELGDRVEFCGWVRHSELKSALQDVRAVVLSQLDTFYNRYLTSPMKAFDAVAHGIPLIFADLPCLAEFLVDGKHGLKFKAEDAGDLADAIDRLIADDALWDGLASNLPELAERFSWRSRAVKISDLIESIGARRNDG